MARRLETAARRPRPDRARGPRRRARLPGRDLPRRDAWRELGIEVEFVQENHSRSGRGILRGLHFQTEPGQAKLVRCLRGAIWDVAVDLRRDSPTYRRWEGHELDDERHRQLFVPVGFAHGFCVLSERGRRRLQAVQLLRPGDRGRDRLGRPRGRRRVADLRPAALGARPRRAEPGRDRRLAALVGRSSDPALGASIRGRIASDRLRKIGGLSPVRSETAESTPLAAFSDPVRRWFEASFEAPTPAQAMGWPAIAAGANTLICAPTGSGKTLAAFLWGIDSSSREPERARTGRADRLRVAAQGPLLRHRAQPARAAEGDRGRRSRSACAPGTRRSGSARRCAASRPTS